MERRPPRSGGQHDHERGAPGIRNRDDSDREAGNITVAPAGAPSSRYRMNTAKLSGSPGKHEQPRDSNRTTHCGVQTSAPAHIRHWPTAALCSGRRRHTRRDDTRTTRHFPVQCICKGIGLKPSLLRALHCRTHPLRAHKTTNLIAQRSTKNLVEPDHVLIYCFCGRRLSTPLIASPVSSSPVEACRFG